MSDEPSHRSGSPRRYERAFILRIWREKDSHAEATRGSIVELESGRRFFFSGLADLNDFLRLRLKASE